MPAARLGSFSKIRRCGDLKPPLNSMRAMPNNLFLILRVVVTLSCLVGVPTVALIGIRSGESTATQRGVSPNGQTNDPRDVSAANAADRETVGRGEIAEPSNTTPRATIRDVAVDATSIARTGDLGGDVNAAEFVTPAVAAGDPLARQFERLRELGATYHRLESSPRAATEFRFHCRVAGFGRAFEAVDPVAANAVGRVLRDVEAAVRKSSTHARLEEPTTSVYVR